MRTWGMLPIMGVRLLAGAEYASTVHQQSRQATLLRQPITRAPFTVASLTGGDCRRLQAHLCSNVIRELQAVAVELARVDVLGTCGDVRPVTAAHLRTHPRVAQLSRISWPATKRASPPRDGAQYMHANLDPPGGPGAPHLTRDSYYIRILILHWLF